MFDGANDYVAVGAPIQSLMGSVNYSIETWINTSTTAISSFFSQTVDGNHEIRGDINTTTTGKVGFITYEGGYSNVIGNTNINDRKWHHIVFTKNSNTGTIYVDGKVDGAGTVVNVIGTAAYTSFGTERYGAASFAKYFSGSIDSTRIYSRALTAAEIMSNYNSSSVEFLTRAGNTADPNDGTGKIGCLLREKQVLIVWIPLVTSGV